MRIRTPVFFLLIVLLTAIKYKVLSAMHGDDPDRLPEITFLADGRHRIE